MKGSTIAFIACAIILVVTMLSVGHDPENGKGIIGGIMLGVGFALMAYLYFIPSLIAGKRSHPDSSAILIVNLLLGWSLIGWVVAIAWALKSNIATQVVISGVPHPEAASSGNQYRSCPFCAEQVLSAAIKCRYCGSDIAKDDTPANAE